MTCAEIREMLAAYSLDALDEQERDAVTGHLERCPPCGLELPDYEKVATGLGLAVEQHDPPSDWKGVSSRRRRGTRRPLGRGGLGAGFDYPASSRPDWSRRLRWWSDSRPRSGRRGCRWS